MTDYKQMYFQLFAAMANAVEAIDRLDFCAAKEILIQAEQVAEEQYICAQVHENGLPHVL